MANRPIEHVYVNDTTYDVKDIYAERSENKASAFSAVPGDTKFPTEKLVKDNLDLKENLSNKITDFGVAPTNTQYPSAKLVKDAIDAVRSELSGDISDIDLTPFELNANRLSAFQSTPDNAHYPSEKLVKDTIDSIKTIVVTTLPDVSEALPDVNYILRSGDRGLCTRKMEMPSGSSEAPRSCFRRPFR